MNTSSVNLVRRDVRATLYNNSRSFSISSKDSYIINRMRNRKQQMNLRNEVILLLLIQNHLLKDEDVHPTYYS